MIYLGSNQIGINVENMRLINQHTVSQAYTGTLQSLYANEVKPYITYGDYQKVCVVVFRNNTSTASGRINAIFFSLSVDIEQSNTTATTKHGGMIRNGFTNLRDLELSNDAKCSADTTVCIYTFSMN